MYTFTYSPALTGVSVVNAALHKYTIDRTSAMSGTITIAASFPAGTIEPDFSATYVVAVVDCNAPLNSASASGSLFSPADAAYKLTEITPDNFLIALDQATSVLQFNAW